MSVFDPAPALPAGATPAPTAPIAPTAPKIPTAWNLVTIVTYAGAFILFLFGCLAEGGVILPASVTGGVALWGGVAAQMAGVVMALVTNITHAGVVKTSLSVGLLMRRRDAHARDGALPVPVMPALPTSWTISTAVTYAGSFALFVMGLLAEAHVVLPAGTSAAVAMWAGVASQIAAALTGVVNTITHASVTKAAMASTQ